MERKEVEIGRPVAVGAVSIIPVAELTVRYRGGKKSVAASGLKRPVGIVALTPNSIEAFRPSGESVTLEQLIEEAPALRKALAAL